MPEPYQLTIRFRPYGSATLIELETERGAADQATLEPPFGDDLPLVLRALDMAQVAHAGQQLVDLPAAARAGLARLGLLSDAGLAADLHARVGRALMRALTSDPRAKTILDQARAEARSAGRGIALALRFPREAYALADLPWELLWEDAQQASGLPLLLAQRDHSACVRYLTLPRPLPPVKPPGERLVVLAASPRAKISADLREQQTAALRRALQPEYVAGAVELIIAEPPLSIGVLLDLVQQHRPDVLSFYGHGLLMRGEGHLLLDGPDGAGEYVSASRLAPLAQSSVQLLLLQACHSDQPGLDLLNGTAGLLSALGVPAIIAMQSYIRVPAASRLQALVLQGVATGQSVQAALAWARASLYAEERDAASWYVPTLTVASASTAPIILCQAGPRRRPLGPAALAQAGARRGAGSMARSPGDGAALAQLAAHSMLPLFSGGQSWEHSAMVLAGLGGRDLAAWALRWALRTLRRQVWLAPAAECQAHAALAADLERDLRHHEHLRDDLARLLDRSAAIPAALDALAGPGELGQPADAGAGLRAQRDLVRALYSDLRHTELVCGPLRQLLQRTLEAQTATLMAEYQAGTAQLSGEIRQVLEEVGKLRAAPLHTPYEPQADQCHQSLQEYIRRVIGECNQLSLADVDSSDPTRAAVELAEVYTRLEVENADLENHFTWSLRRLSALEVLGERQRMVLLGAPGSGKSTFINFVSLLMGSVALGRSEWSERLRAEWSYEPQLPVRVELRPFATWLAEQPEPPATGDPRPFWGWLAQKYNPEPARLLHAQAMAGKVLILLDGLDEVMIGDAGEPLARVLRVIRAVADTVDKSRVLITCRTLDYTQQPQRQLAGWSIEQLIPFSDDLRDEFIRRWYRMLQRLGRLASSDAELLHAQLQREIRHRKELRRLGGNPLLLTMMVLLHSYEGSLPESWVKLYTRCVELLIHRWRPIRAGPSLGAQLGLPSWGEDDLSRLLDRLGMAAHEREATKEGEHSADLPRGLVVETARRFFEPYGKGKEYARAETFCNYIGRHSNGVLQQTGPDTYSFPHRSFQEYLAARRLIADEDWDEDESEFVTRALRRIDAGPHWHEVLRMAVSQQVSPGNQVGLTALLVDELLSRHWPTSDAGANDVILAGEILAEVGHERLLRLGPRRARIWDEAITALTRLLRLRPDGTSILGPDSRRRAGQVLGALGDPRPGVCGIQPDWCPVPAGPFLIGSASSDADAFGDETPQQSVVLPAFQIARYPVTNAQWQAFIEGGGYQERRWWSAAGWEARQRERWSGPRHWDELAARAPNHPVVGVCWYEASAYCRWLSAQLHLLVRLPSKAEWEKAARGTSGLTYPWGDEWHPERANVRRQVAGTTPVGCYPDGASAYGLLDMSGNVLEWTATPWADSYDVSDGTGIDRDDDASPPADDIDEPRYVARGGAWNLTERSARCAYQLWRRPLSTGDNLGLRVVAEV